MMEKCPLCSECFDQIVIHIINCVHWNTRELEDPVCSICKQSVRDISLHFISHHSRPHKCNKCNVRFFERRNLIKHMKTHLRSCKKIEFMTENGAFTILP